MGTRLTRLRPQAPDPSEGHRLARRVARTGRAEGAAPAMPGRSGSGFEPLDSPRVWPPRYLGHRLGGTAPDPDHSAAAGVGFGLGGFRFQLRRGPIAQALAARRDPGGLEAEADRTADHAVNSSQFGAGASDARSLWGYFNSRLGQDLSQVRIHAEGPTARSLDALGANAATKPEDIYFGTGRYRPTTPEGAHLLAHELTHVVQQRRGGAPAVQFDLRQILPVAHGEFFIDMEAWTSAEPGLHGTIRFLPDPHGPVSARIGLIQAGRIIDRAGETAPPGEPMDPTRIPRKPWPAEAWELETTGAWGAERGWSLDVDPAAHRRTTPVSPAFIEAWQQRCEASACRLVTEDLR